MVTVYGRIPRGVLRSKIREYVAAQGECRLHIDNQYQLVYNLVSDIELQRKAYRMTIIEGKVKHDYIVTDIVIDEVIMRRLEALGINSGTRLRLMNQKKNGTVIIKVRGTRWAIGRDIAGGIQVTPAETEEAYGND